jgi:hypothetical protein
LLNRIQQRFKREDTKGVEEIPMVSPMEKLQGGFIVEKKGEGSGKRGRSVGRTLPWKKIIGVGEKEGIFPMVEKIQPTYSTFNP